MKTMTHQAYAQALIDARFATRNLVNPSASFQDFSLEDGYDICRMAHELLEQKGFRSVGRKIGFTNRDTWEEFGLETPIWAHMYEQSLFLDKPSPLSLSDRTAPRIEPEIVLKLAEDIADPEALKTEQDWLAALEWIAIGFEIVDCHYPGWEFTAADAVADFGVHGCLTVSEPMPLAGQDADTVIRQLADLQVVLSKNGEQIAEGKGSNALGSPLTALRYLAQTIAGQDWAPSLKAGEVITTGTLTPLPYVKAGESWSVSVSGLALPGLELSFA